MTQSPLSLLHRIRRLMPVSLSLLLGLWAHSSLAQSYSLVDQVWEVVDREFFDPNFNPSQWELQRQQVLAHSASHRDPMGVIQTALQSLGDPYTRLIDPRLSQMQDSFVGVGLHLGSDPETGYLVTIAPIESSPAYEAGLMPGDLITAIDGISTLGMTVDEAILLICGQKGTSVTLSLLQDNQATTVSIKRDGVTLDAVRYQLMQIGQGRVGYIRLAHFGAEAPEMMAQAIQKLEAEGIEGYILDLRANPGGLVESSVEVAQLWLDRGTIVTLKDREGQSQRIMATESAVTHKPLAVLVDQGTASASEILSAALRDHQRALLVGTRTFGKGSVQSMHTLEGGTGLAVTTAYYHTPQGFQIDQQGLEPDIAVDLTPQERRRLATQRELIATADDPQFVEAIRALFSL